MIIALSPLGIVVNNRQALDDDGWGDVTSKLVFDPERFSEKSLKGLDEFSHIQVIGWMHQIPQETIEYNDRHPRDNADWPSVGIFAQRGSARPNQMAISTAEYIGHDGLAVEVKGLDLVHGTPILDLKPVMSGFQVDDIKEPDWAKDIMKNYW